MPPLLLFGAAASAAVVANAALRRRRLFAAFAGVFSGTHALSTAALGAALPGATGLLGALSVPVYVHLFALATPAWRPSWYRAAVSVPAHLAMATSVLSLPFVAANALGAPAALLVVPLAAGVAGLFDSLRASRGVVAIDLDGGDAGPLGRVEVGDPGRPGEALRVVQITDPHLGPFMTVERLREVARRAVEADPDLVLLTGDYLTMESHADPGLLAGALEPLRPLSGRTFACLGNHDHEAPATVREGLERAGVRLLVDEMATAATRLGEVEVAGYDYRRRGRAEHLAAATAAMPARRGGVARLALLHDPGAFASLPEGAADLVFSGHTHGGQLGLLRLGLPHTAVSLFSSIPDHGLWGLGRGRLYVHRGTGQYGFPLRVGVPAEDSLILVRGGAGWGEGGGG